MHEFEQRFPVERGLAHVTPSLDGQATVPLSVAPEVAAGRTWSVPATQGEQQLHLVSDSARPLYYEIQLGYEREQKQLPARGAGLALERRYLRWVGGKWQALAVGESLAVGDWVRVELLIDNPMFRQHIALSDPVPGGLRPTADNLVAAALPGVGRSDDDYYFYERQLRPDTVRLYADYLPAGQHRVTYPAQVTAAGRFLALPALVEAMYDDTIQARTSPDTLTILAVPAKQ